ncbi:MAG: hypothetical protein WCV93_03575 [Candidatus Shapirobacteria bacterium]
MKSEIKRHFLPLLGIFTLTSLFWVFGKVSWFHFVFLFFGLAFGSFFLDLDHLIYWFYLRPNLDESRQAKILWNSRDFKGLIKLLELTHKQHISLIFHHYFAQIILVLISLFVFTSSNNEFTQGFLIAMNLHLLVDEFEDYQHNKHHLQDWLFARENRQIPQKYLRYYLGLFFLTTLLFTFLLIRSKI